MAYLETGEKIITRMFSQSSSSPYIINSIASSNVPLEILSDSNLNNYTSPGVYYCNSGTIPLGLPQGVEPYGLGLQVTQISESNYFQTLYLTNSEENVIIYTRYTTSNGWSDWTISSSGGETMHCDEILSAIATVQETIEGLGCHGTSNTGVVELMSIAYITNLISINVESINYEEIT